MMPDDDDDDYVLPWNAENGGVAEHCLGVGTKTGRFSCSQPNLSNLPKALDGATAGPSTLSVRSYPEDYDEGVPRPHIAHKEKDMCRDSYETEDMIHHCDATIGHDGDHVEHDMYGGIINRWKNKEIVHE